MKFYIDDDNNSLNIVQPITSASTLISSLTAQVKDFILSRFPKDLFKSVYIDTVESATDQRRRELYNKDADKIPYPSLAITPEITLDDPIGGMEKHLHLSSPNLYLRKDIRGTYKKLLVDPKRKVRISYTSDYITTNFNFRITTNSFIQNADLSYFLKSNFQAGTFQFLNNRHVQAEIPKTFIKIIADVLHLDINNSYEMDQLRLYLIGTGLQDGLIEKKINLATGKECFFINERVNFLTLMNDLDAPGSIIRDGQSEGEYTISFRFQVSTWLPNNFIMNISKKTIDDLRCEVNINDVEQDDGFYSSNTRVEADTIYLLKKETHEFTDSCGKTQIGQLIDHEIYTYKVDETIPEINFMNRMNSEFKSVHDYAVNGMPKKIDMTSLLHFRILYNGAELDPLYYTIDYDKMIINVSKNLNSDIAVALYVNRALYESLKESRNKDKFYFNDGILTSMIINDGLGNTRVPIYNIDKNNNYSSNVESMLRIQTVYGTGYIKLTNINNKSDGYRICVGFNADKPIIKKINLN